MCHEILLLPGILYETLQRPWAAFERWYIALYIIYVLHIFITSWCFNPREQNDRKSLLRTPSPAAASALLVKQVASILIRGVWISLSPTARWRRNKECVDMCVCVCVWWQERLKETIGSRAEMKSEMEKKSTGMPIKNKTCVRRLVFISRDVSTEPSTSAGFIACLRVAGIKCV